MPAVPETLRNKLLYSIPLQIIYDLQCRRYTAAALHSKSEAFGVLQNILCFAIELSLRPPPIFSDRKIVQICAFLYRRRFFY